jgi:hypothetical protein
MRMSKHSRRWLRHYKKHAQRTRKHKRGDMCAKKNFCAGTMDIPRNIMPQIEDLAEFRAKLKEYHGVQSHKSRRLIGVLKPSQGEINEERVAPIVQAIKNDTFKSDNPIVVSADDFVIDGHHRWAAFRKVYPTKKKVDVVVLEAPASQILLWTANPRLGTQTEAF